MKVAVLVIVLFVFALFVTFCFTFYLVVRKKRRSAFIYPRQNALLGDYPPDINQPSLRRTAPSCSSSSSLDSNSPTPVKKALMSNCSSGDCSTSEQFSIQMSDCTFLPSQSTLSDLRMSQQNSNPEDGIKSSVSSVSISRESSLSKTKSTLF